MGFQNSNQGINVSTGIHLYGVTIIIQRDSIVKPLSWMGELCLLHEKAYLDFPFALLKKSS
jgi:hypothetical protein